MSDVWNDAADAITGPKVYFGQLLTEAYYAYISFKKGESKVEFDPGQHNEANKYVVVKIGSITTLDDGRIFDINKEYVCPKAGSNVGKEWEQIVNPSLKKLGIHPRDLADKWASWEMVETGRSWNHKDTGNLVKGTAHKFSKFYPDEATCRQAEAKFYNRPDDGPAENLDKTHPMPEDTPADNGPTRADAVGFLDQFWTLAGHDPDAFFAAIANQELLAKHFGETVEEIAACPEVVKIVEGAATGFVEQNETPF